jgi:hypothetical protein
MADTTSNMTRSQSTPVRRFQWLVLDLFAMPFLFVAAVFFIGAIFEIHKAHWGMAAALLFMAVIPAAIGFFLLWGASHGVPHLENGATPWLQRPDWRAGRVSFSEAGQAFIASAFAILFSAFTGMFCYFLTPMVIRDRSYPVIAILTIFSIVSVVLLVPAFLTTLRWITFRKSVFQMDTVPFSPGGTLSGGIQLGRQFVADSEFQLRLICAEHWITGGAKTARSHEKVLWNAEQLSPSDGRSVPVAFAIPNDGIPTGQVHDGHRVWWRLSASVQSNRLKYYSTFEVPVFPQGTDVVPAQSS